MGCYILQDPERLILKISSSLSCKITVNIASLLFPVNFFSVFLNAISGGNNFKIFYPRDFYFCIWVLAYCETNTVLKLELPLNYNSLSAVLQKRGQPICNCSHNPASKVEMVHCSIYFNEVEGTGHWSPQYLFTIRAWSNWDTPLAYLGLPFLCRK